MKPGLFSIANLRASATSFFPTRVCPFSKIVSSYKTVAVISTVIFSSSVGSKVRFWPKSAGRCQAGFDPKPTLQPIRSAVPNERKGFPNFHSSVVSTGKNFEKSDIISIENQHGSEPVLNARYQNMQIES
jgi:hypothetical protein